MPLIHVLNASPSDQQRKRALIAELTRTFARVMGIRPDTIGVIVQEVPRDSWSVAGVTLENSDENEAIPSA